MSQPPLAGLMGLKPKHCFHHYYMTRVYDEQYIVICCNCSLKARSLWQRVIPEGHGPHAPKTDEKQIYDGDGANDPCPAPLKIDDLEVG